MYFSFVRQTSESHWAREKSKYIQIPNRKKISMIRSANSREKEKKSITFFFFWYLCVIFFKAWKAGYSTIWKVKEKPAKSRLIHTFCVYLSTFRLWIFQLNKCMPLSIYTIWKRSEPTVPHIHTDESRQASVGLMELKPFLFLSPSACVYLLVELVLLLLGVWAYISDFFRCRVSDEFNDFPLTHIFNLFSRSLHYSTET